MDLTNEELVFLKRQGLGPSDVFDTRGMSSAKWKQKIKLEGKTVALGTPCAEAGHRLRTRAGHCVHCDTKKLGYQKRHRSFACLYIAGSKAQQLIKVGTAKRRDAESSILKPMLASVIGSSSSQSRSQTQAKSRCKHTAS